MSHASRSRGPNRLSRKTKMERGYFSMFGVNLRDVTEQAFILNVNY